jgi:hypothetical protein
MDARFQGLDSGGGGSLASGGGRHYALTMKVTDALRLLFKLSHRALSHRIASGR